MWHVFKDFVTSFFNVPEVWNWITLNYVRQWVSVVEDCAKFNCCRASDCLEKWIWIW
jgi:hypothetical protein